MELSDLRNQGVSLSNTGHRLGNCNTQIKQRLHFLILLMCTNSLRVLYPLHYIVRFIVNRSIVTGKIHNSYAVTKSNRLKGTKSSGEGCRQKISVAITRTPCSSVAIERRFFST